jgi:hypothetical protein
MEIEKRGLHNWKNLFRKPTLNDWIIFILLMMVMFMAWAYQRDIAVCKQAINFSLGNNILFQEPNLNTDFPKLNFTSSINHNVPTN